MILPAGRRAAVACTSCGTPLPMLPGTGAKRFQCAVCDAELQLEVFPAFFRGTGSGAGVGITGTEGEASCFYHEKKRAAAVCEECGRFLCSLCEVRIGGRDLCPACVERGRTEGSLELLVTRRTLYDGIALSLSFLPLLIPFITLLTAPMAIYVVVRYWNRPGSILPRTRFRFALAAFFALLQVAGWSFFLMEIFESV